MHQGPTTGRQTSTRNDANMKPKPSYIQIHPHTRTHPSIKNITPKLSNLTVTRKAVGRKKEESSAQEGVNPRKVPLLSD